MPYIILIAGIIIGLFALYRLFINANPAQIKHAMRVIIIVIYVGILLFFALRGLFVVSLALLVLCVPFVISYFKAKMNKQTKLLPPKNDDAE
tara:strand:- start:346 stop:621 length:276 start_codon:yes stop_codon:yes gene_type:complete